MSSSRQKPIAQTGAREDRSRTEALLRAVLDGDLVEALHVVEAAGGTEALRDEETLALTLVAERSLGLDLEDARALARAIHADVDPVGSLEDEGAEQARALLIRLVSALGLTARMRLADEPVLIELGSSEAPVVTRTTSAPEPGRPIASTPNVTSSRPLAPVVPVAPDMTLAASPEERSSGRGVPAVRGFWRNVFEGVSFLPRVDTLALAIAPTAQPGVYAIQRRALASADATPGLRAEEVRDRLGPGRPLPAALAMELSSRMAVLGQAVDLGRLRVHDDAAADDLCRELEAEAFALGHDLVFRAGAFRPDEPSGLELILHELTHVWQQARGLVAPGVDADPALEREAQRSAERLADTELESAQPSHASNDLEPATELWPVGTSAAEPDSLDGAPESATPLADDAEALQRCGPQEMAKKKNPPRGHDDPVNPDPPKPDPPDPDPPKPKPEPRPDPPKPKPDPNGKEDCESCPEPDLAHQTFKPMKPLPPRKAAAGQKHVELHLAGHKVQVEVPEDQADGEVEVVFKQNPSPFAALVFKKAKLRFDEGLRVLGGEIACAVSLGKYVQVSQVNLRVFEDGRVGAELRGIQVNVADNVRALVDLTIGPEGVWGMATVTADQVFVSDLVTVKDGLLHVRVETNGSVNLHGAVTVQVHGVGEATLEACYVDGKWGGRLTLARREELELMPGVVLEEVELTGCFAPDEWWIYGAVKVRLFDRFRCVADAKYHWKEGTGKWSFEADLEQFESVALLADVTLENTHVHVKYEEGEWDPATFHAELHHPWVLGTVDGTWNIEENLWNGFGRVELARQLPMGDSGITLDQAEVTAHVVDNDLTEIHGKVRATFPFQGQPTFELSCLDAVYKVKEEELWATADLRSIRDIQFGSETGFHAIVHQGAGATTIVEKSALVKTLGGVAFDARHRDKILGDGGMYFNWVPGGGVNAGGRFDLRERFGLPDYAAGPLYLLPQPGHFEFLVENGQPKFIEVLGVGFEIAQGEGEEAGLIGGQVSGRFDFDTNSGDLTGTAKVLRSWREDLGGFGALTVLEGGQLDVAIEKSELVKAEGKLDLQLDVNETEHVSAFTLQGHVDGKYNPKTKKVSGKVSAELKTDLAVRIGEQGDEVVIKEGSNFETTMTEGALDLFTLKLKVQYWRKGELFLEGDCKEAVFDFKTGLLDFLGTLTLKKDIEKRLGESDYSLALVKDVTNLEVEVKKNELVRIGGDIAVQLRDGEGPLLEGSLKNADYRIEEELFSGDLDLELERNIGWPKRQEDQGALPPTLRVELVRGSHVSGHIQDNVFREATVELRGLVHYQDKEQAEAYLHGRWNLDSDKFDLDGYFKLTDDLVFGAEAAPDEQSIGRWGLAFEKDSQVTVGIVQNALQPVGVDVKMQLRRGKEVCAKGNVTGQYAFGQEGGFTGGVHLEVVKEIALGKAGRFDMVLGTGTRGDGQLVQSALTEAALSVELFATEKAQKKAMLTVDVAYTGGSRFSGTAAFAVLDPIRLGERQVGKDLYAVELNTKTRAAVGLADNELASFSGEVGLDVLRGKERFAEGDFSLAYDFRNPTAGVTADGAARILRPLTLGTVGKYTFVLEGGSSLAARIENSGLAWIEGRLELGLEVPRDGRFATLTLGGKYVGGDKPDFNGDASAIVHKEHDLGFTAYNYGFFLQPAGGFTIKVEHSELTEMHGQIGLVARQRSKKKGGMNGNVSASLNGDAFKKGDKWEFGGRATATVEGDIQVGTAGNYAFSIQGGTGIDIQVAKNRFVSVEGTLTGKVAESGKDFLGFGCWVRYEAAENDNEPGWVDARGDCKLLGEKELYRSGGFAFSLMPTSGYTAFIVVERNEVKEVGGRLAFRLENTNAKPQPLRVSGFAEGHYDNTLGVFSGRGDIRLDSDLEFAMGKNKIVLEKGSGGMTEIQDNELQRLGGTLIGRFDDEEGKLVQLRAAGEFNAQTPELEKLEGSAVLLRELKLGPASNPWIIVDKGLSIEAKMAHNKLTWAKGSNGRFRVPALRIAGGFDYLTMNALGPKTTYAGKGFLEMEMLKEDKAKGRKLKGRLDLEYREDDTWNARGTVDYDITPYLGGQLTAEMDQQLDPVLGGTLVMKKKEMLPARDLFETKFPIIPDVTIPVAGIAGFGFGARGYFGLSSLPMTLSASVGIQNFRPRQMNVPDFTADAAIDWGLRLKAGALAYLDARISVAIASASIGIQGTAEVAGDAIVKAKGKLAGKQGKYWGELGVGLSFAPSVTLKAQPFAQASLFSKQWKKTWDAYTYELGEVFKYEWGSTYKFGDEPEAPKANSDRQDAAMSGAPRQDTSRVNTKAEADAFGQERASSAVAPTQGKPGIESGEDLKKKKEKEEADNMKGLEEDGKEAADIGSVMAAVGNIMTQLGHILGSLTFGPVGLVLCLAWKWIKGSLKKLYDDWCTVRDYVWNNWNKIKEYLPDWFVSFIDFMKDPFSAAEKWWNADEYARKAVHAGEHRKAPAEVRGNLAANLFAGWAGEGDRRAIEDIFEVSLDKGDLRAVIMASEYPPNDYASAWYRRNEWGGSRLKKTFDAAGFECNPGVLSGLFDEDETASGPTDQSDARALAGQGLHGGGGSLPFQQEIQAAFGDHDLSGVEAHTDGAARDAARALGANAYASGEHVAFGKAPDLHTAAHEAAHVVQQRRGLVVGGGVGERGDALERHADMVADKVVAGESAESLLDAVGSDGAARAVAVQKKEDEDKAKAKDGAKGPKTQSAEEGEGEEESEPPVVELHVEVKSQETPGVKPVSANAFGQVMPYQTAHISKIETKGELTRVHLVHFTDFQWGVQSLGNEDATVAAASLEPATRGRFAGLPKWKQMVADVLPMPGTNAPRQEAFWSREHTEAHELFHIEDLRGWMVESAPAMAQKVFAEAVFTSAELERELQRAADEVQSVVFLGAYTYLVADKKADDQYYERPGEIRAYEAGAPGLRALADQIKARGQALEKAAADEAAKGGDDATKLRTDTALHGEPTRGPGLDEQHPIKTPGGDGDKGGNADSPRPLWPKVKVELAVTEAQDATLEPKVFGSVVPEFEFEVTDAVAQAGNALIEGTFKLTLHWGVQSLGRKDASPSLATAEPETSPEFEGLDLKVYEAMFLDIVPNELGFPAQSTYWSKALAEMHEKVHLADFRAWAEDSGKRIAEDSWMMREYTTAELATQVEAQRKETAVQLQLDSVRKLKGGFPPPPYFQQPTEMNAFGTVAPHLRALADQIRSAGELAEVQAKNEGTDEGQGGKGSSLALQGPGDPGKKLDGPKDESHVPAPVAFRFTASLPESKPIAGYLLPSVGLSIEAQPSSPAEGAPSIEAVASAISPRVQARLEDLGKALRKSAASPFPSGPAADEAAKATFTEEGALSTESVEVTVTEVRPPTWRLVGDGDWADYVVNLEEFPNLDVVLPDGTSFAAAVLLLGKLKPRPQGQRRYTHEDHEATLALVEEQLVSVYEALFAEPDFAQRINAQEPARSLRAPIEPLFSNFALALESLETFLTPFGDSDRATDLIEGKLGGEGGALTISTAAGENEVAWEKEIRASLGERFWRWLWRQGPPKVGAFTAELTEVMKANPDLSVGECAKRVVEKGRIKIDGEDKGEQTPHQLELPGSDPQSLDKGARYALVTYAGDYDPIIHDDGRKSNPKEEGDLAGAINDANTMAAALAARKYEVTLAANVRTATFKEALQELEAKAKQGDEVVFYYAGHGLPTGLSLVDHQTVPHSVLLGWAFRLRTRGVNVELVIDACHSASLIDSAEEAMADASAETGDERGALAREVRRELELLALWARRISFNEDYRTGAELEKARPGSEGLKSGDKFDNKASNTTLHENKRAADRIMKRLTAMNGNWLEKVGAPLLSAAELSGPSEGARLTHAWTMVRKALEAVDAYLREQFGATAISGAALEMGPLTKSSGDGARGPDAQGGDKEDQPEWLQPEAQIQVKVTEARDAKLGPDVFGSVDPEFLITELEARPDGKRAAMKGVFHLALHWDVQSLGRKEAKPSLASTAPEQSPEFAGTMASVYQAMWADLTPDEFGYPPQTTYWSQALAEMHEKVHLSDYRNWAELFGAQLAKQNLEIREIAAAELDEELESLRVATERRLMFEAIKNLKGGIPPQPYLLQPTEAHAFQTVAPYLRQLAKLILEKGQALDREDKAKTKAQGGAMVKTPTDATTAQQEPGVRGPLELEHAIEPEAVPAVEPTKVSIANGVVASGAKPLVQATLRKGDAWSHATATGSATVSVQSEVAWDLVYDARGNLVIVEHGASGHVELSARSARNLVIVGADGRSAASVDGDENVVVQSLADKSVGVDLGGHRAFSVQLGDKVAASAKPQEDERGTGKDGAEAREEAEAPAAQDLREDGGLHIETDFHLTHESPRDLAIDDSVFGKVKTELRQEGLRVEILGSRAIIHGTLRAIHHWNVHSAGLKEASVEAASAEPETDPQYAGWKVYQAMAMDIVPFPNNLSVHAVYTNTPLTLEHERFHIQDSTEYLDANARGVLTEGWQTAWIDPQAADGGRAALDTYSNGASRRVEGALISHLKGSPIRDYCDQPTELRAYADGAPKFRELANQIIARGMALERDALASQTGGTGDAEPLVQTSEAHIQQMHRSPEGLASKGDPMELHSQAPAGIDPRPLEFGQGDARIVHLAPGVMKFESEVVRGLALDEKSFGAMQQDNEITQLAVRMVDGQPTVDATLKTTYRWDVQSRGSMQWSLDLVSTELESGALDERFKDIPTWKAMEFAIRPNELDMPFFAPYWDEAEAISHELFHVKDDQDWVQSDGARALGEGWAKVQFVALEPEISAAEAEARAKDWAQFVAEDFYWESIEYYMGGENPREYQDREGEKRAYKAGAQVLHGYADQIKAKGEQLEAEEDRTERGRATQQGAELDLDSSTTPGGHGPAMMGHDGPITVKDKTPSGPTPHEEATVEAAPEGFEVRSAEVKPTDAELAGGYLVPRLVASIAFRRTERCAPDATLESFVADTLQPKLVRATLNGVRQLVPSVGAPLPERGAVLAAVTEHLRRMNGVEIEGFELKLLGLQGLDWRLLAHADTKWDKLSHNVEGRPNLDAVVAGGPRVHVTTMGSGVLNPVDGARPSVAFDAVEAKDLDELMEMLVNSALMPHIAAGKACDTALSVQVAAVVRPRMEGYLEAYGLGFRLTRLGVTQNGQAYVPPTTNPTTRAQKEAAAGDGKLSIVAAASSEQYSYEQDKYLGEKEVPAEYTTWEKVKSVFGYEKPNEVVEIYERQGDFTFLLLQVMKENPKLTITECAERVVAERKLSKQHPEIFEHGDDRGVEEVGTNEGGALKEARRKYAVVAGASNYGKYSSLPGAASDARNMTTALTARGYEVVHLVDPTLGELGASLVALEKKLQGEESVVVYFAGHGTDGGKGGKSGVVTSGDDEIYDFASLYAWVARYKAKGAEVELVLDTCHSGVATDMAVSNFFAGAHHLELDTRGQRIRETFFELNKLSSYVDDHLRGRLKTKNTVQGGQSKATFAGQTPQVWFENPAVAAEVGDELHHQYLSFGEATGLVLLDLKALQVARGERRLASLVPIINSAMRVARHQLAKTASASRTDQIREAK